MARHSAPAGTSTLLTIGNVVTIGMQLYRRHAWEYLSIALSALVWVVVPLLAMAVFLVAMGQVLDPGMGVLVGLAGFIILMYGLAKYLAASAAISRRSFYHLTQQEESVAETHNYIRRRTWGFWRIAFFQVLLFLALTVALYVVLTIVIMMLVFGLGGASLFQGGSFANPGTAMVIGIIMVLVIIIFASLGAYILYWFSARLIISEMDYAIEDDSRPLASMGRSWQLTGHNVRRLVLGLVMVVLAGLPIQVLVQLVSGLVTTGITFLLPASAPMYTPVTLLLSYSVGLGLGVLLLPLWQSVKAVMYYDLMERREGLSLDLSDRSGLPSIRQWLNRVTLLTPESVELDFTLAGIGNRSWALLLDYLFLIGGLLLFWIFLGWTSSSVISFVEFLGVNYDDAWVWFLAIALLITFLIFTGYFVAFETLAQGRTPGKRIMHLRVIQDNGQPVTLGQATLRSLLRPVDDLLFIGAFFIALGKREKRLGDWVAGTQVIQEEFADKHLSLVISSSATRLAAQLLPKIHLQHLSPSQFATLHDYLQRRSMIAPWVKKELRLNLARQAKEQVGLEEVPKGVSADQFLEALYIAYQRQGKPS